jgi:transcription antitermination factor NusG
LKRWYVVQTERRSEFDAAAELVAQGFGTFLPMEQKLWRRDDRTKKWGVAHRLLYPGYLLVEFDIREDCWGEISRTRGVHHLLPTHQEMPLPVRGAVIERLFAKDIGRCRMTLDQMLGSQRKANKRPAFEEGTQVRVNHGAFQGPADVKQDSGGDTLRVVMGWLEIVIPADSVEAIEAAA